MKSKFLKYSLLTVILFVTSCNSKNGKSNSKEIEKSTQNSTEQLLEKENQDIVPLVQAKEIVTNNYKGKIGDNLEVLFHINDDNNKVSGFYYYKKIGIDIAIVGNIKKDSLFGYELDYKKDTVAVIKGEINDNGIEGKWINSKNGKEYSLNIEKINKELTPFPSSLVGMYYHEGCNLRLSFYTSKGEYYYAYKSNERSLTGKVSFYREDDLFIQLDNIEFAEDYFDVILPEEDLETEKKYENLKKIGKRRVGIDCFYSPTEITIQNYGNAMNYYVKLYDCGEKYIHLKKQ